MTAIRPLTETAEYQALLLRDVREHPEAFRIGPEDVLKDPIPFPSSDPNDFTLGIFGKQLMGRHRQLHAGKAP